jgi:hypothetical protein
MATHGTTMRCGLPDLILFSGGTWEEAEEQEKQRKAADEEQRAYSAAGGHFYTGQYEEEVEELGDSDEERAPTDFSRVHRTEAPTMRSEASSTLANEQNLLQIKFVEVKGPRDHLSSAQVVWLNLFLHFGVQVEVCRVSEE